jgi:hypothetical protein
MGAGKYVKGGIELLEDLLKEVNKPAKAVTKAAPVAPTLLPAVPTVQAPAVMIPSRLNEIQEKVRKGKGAYGARRVERAADEVPNLEQLYNTRALLNAFNGHNASAMMTMNPRNFEHYSVPLDPSFTGEFSKRRAKTGRQMGYKEYMEDYLPNVGGFDEIPFLLINKEEQGLPLIPFLTGHEGRHRNRVLASKGEQAGLVKLWPNEEMRDPFPQGTQEEYIEALRKELGLTDNLVYPEKYGEPGESIFDRQIQRPAIKLPDIYAEGGEVHMGAGGTVKKGIELVETFLKELNKPAKAAVKAAPQGEVLKIVEQTVNAPAITSALGIKKGSGWSGTKTPDINKLAKKANKFIYHSDVAPNVNDLHYGIEPQQGGSWVKEIAHGTGVDDVDEFLESTTPLAWFSDTPSWVKMKVSRHLNKPLTEVTEDDIRNYGHLAIINKKNPGLENIWRVGEQGLSEGPYSKVQTIKGEEIPAYRTDLYQEDYRGNKEPFGVERNEWISTQPVEPFVQLTGDALIEFLKKSGNFKEGGEVHMMGGGRPPKKTTLEEDLKSFKDPALALADLLAGALRGTTTAATGFAGDMEELYRQYGKGAIANAVRQLVPTREGKATTLPTIEEMKAMLPPVVPAGAGRSSQVADVGQFLGENNPFAPTAIAAVKPVVKAAARGALDLAKSEPARKAVNRVAQAAGVAPMRIVPEGSRAIAQTPYERSLEQGYNHDWFHGTTGDIKSFDPKFLGESTNANSAKKGFFFARDPQSPPEHLKVKSNDPEAIELLRRFGMSDEDIAKKNAVLFEGHGSSTASDYAGLGGGRDYKEAMRNAALAEKRGDWDAYDKYTQEAEAAVFGERDYRQGLVAKHGDARDQLLHAIDQAFSYGRPEAYKNMSQEDLTNLDKTRQRLMPYSWYMHENAPFEKILEEASKYGTESQLQNLAEEIKNFKSVTNERRLADVEQGANVLPVALRYKNPYVHDFGGASYRDESYSDLIDKTLAGDHDALLLLNTFDPGGGKPKMVDVGVVFDPSQIRSRFAEFDPEHLESSDILKKSGGAVMMADGGMITIEEFLRKQGY